MYLRPAFVQDDPVAIRALIQDYPFAQLVTTGPRGIEASHLPIMCMPDGDGFVLAAHFAAGNPQCDAIGRGDEALAIFSGPHAYISPAWYQAQPSVPTWDFAAVHVYGALDPVTDPAVIAAGVDVMPTWTRLGSTSWGCRRITEAGCSRGSVRSGCSLCEWRRSGR